MNELLYPGDLKKRLVMPNNNCNMIAFFMIVFTEPGFDEEWAALQRIRRYLIDEIDIGSLLDEIRRQNIIDENEKKFLSAIPDKAIRTEAYLDILETKNPEVYDQFLEIIADSYPHVYLTVTGQIEDEDDGCGGMYGVLLNRGE